MDGEELGGTYVIAVEELGLNGLWSTIKDLVESRLPLRGITLPNKVGKPVAVPRLPLMFVLSTDMRLKRLKQYSHSPVTWFRNPHTHLILVSTADVHEYKSTLRAQLKRVTSDIEREWGGPGIGSEWLLLYVRPFELDPNDKSARRVFEKLCDDFASKRRERVVRLDIPLQAFTGPAAAAAARSGSSSSSRPGYGVQAGGSAQGVGVWGAGATGLDELCTGLRDSIRAAFEARQAAYDAEVRRLLNERRDPGWSFLTLYLVKDSFALMLEGAGLWEDAFQEYVELETVYLDTLEAAAAAAAAAAATPAEAAAAAVRAAADFGLTRSDSEDCASLLSSSWRGMRRLVLCKKAVQEFHFRQYLFAAQARVLLRLGRPVDVAERGLVFVQHFLGILAAREAAGLVKPWFKECWAFSACMALITAVTAASAQRSSSSNGGSNLQPEWDTSDLANSSSNSGPAGPAAQAAVRQLGAALAAEKAAAAAAAAAGGSLGLELRAAASTRRSTESDRGRIRSIITSPSPAAYSPSGGGAAPSAAAAAAGSAGATSASTPILTGSEWELDASSTAIKVMGGSSSSSDKAAPSGSSTPAAAAAAGVLGVLDEYDQDVPPLDLGVLRGQAVTPGTAGLLLQAGEQRRELLDRLYCCLLGHLYHLARGELLRLGSALRLPEAAAAAAAGSASILQLGRAAFAPAAAGSGSTAAMINKYADGSGGPLTYEVHTPKLALEQDPLAAALGRADSQSTPYLNSFTSIANSSSAASTAGNSPTAAAAVAGGGGGDTESSGDAATARVGPPAADGDSGSSAAAGRAGIVLDSARTAPAGINPSAASLSAASGLGLSDTPALSLGPPPPKVATHVRSASALPAAGGAGTSGAAGGGFGGLVRPGGLSTNGGLSPRRLEGLVDPGAIAALQAPNGGSSSRGAAQQQPSLPAAAAASAAAGVPGWVGEWRLQLALRSPACFEELLLALSRRAAWCYARAGRLRSSALIYADVAQQQTARRHLRSFCSLWARFLQARRAGV
ncbi:hypothetical protein OEZ86_003632 [Tetradesmus obliquus]|nr:hypothetical protein OEZ86_003632 [Tetradesmus obliquus]